MIPLQPEARPRVVPSDALVAAGTVPRVFEVSDADRVGSLPALLPARDRTNADLTVLDITKWFGETSGGVKTYLREKARFVAAEPSFRHVLVIPGPFDSVALSDGVRVYRLRGPRIPTQSAYRFLFATCTTARIVAHERPSIIEVGSPFAVPWVAAMAAKPTHVPLVSFHHMSLGPGAWWGGSGARAGVVSGYLRLLNRLFRLTIAASDFAVDELHRAGIDRVVRVPLGVDLDLFHPRRRADQERARRRFGIPLQVPVALFVGRLAPEKRLDVALDAWPAIEQATGAVLVVVGAGSHAAELRRRSKARNVLWLPYQSDRDLVAQLFATGDVYVSPSSQETFGLAALEALASGLPVLTSHRGGVTELVERSGAGRAFDAESVSSFAEGFRAILSAGPRALGDRGRAYAEREHAWDAVFRRLFEVYRQVLA